MPYILRTTHQTVRIVYNSIDVYIHLGSVWCAYLLRFLFESFMYLYGYKYILRMPISFLKNYCNHILVDYVWLNNNNKWNHMNAFAPPTETLWLVLISPILVTWNVKTSKTQISWKQKSFVFHLYFALTLFTCRHPHRRDTSMKERKKKNVHRHDVTIQVNILKVLWQNCEYVENWFLFYFSILDDIFHGRPVYKAKNSI